MEQDQDNTRKNRTKKKWIVLIILLVLFLGLKYMSTLKSPPLEVGIETKSEKNLINTEPSLKSPDSSNYPSSKGKDSIEQSRNSKSSSMNSTQENSIKISPKISEEDVLIDTLQIWAEPWGGRHYQKVSVQLNCKSNCKIFFKVDSGEYQEFLSPIQILKSSVLTFYGKNSIGERSPETELNYDIVSQDNPCEKKGGVWVQGKSGDFCIDTYEYPNRKNTSPKTFVNQETANQLCREQEKNLCTLEEWQSACMGPKSSKYPYGDQYESNYCGTKESQFKFSGHFPACRAYEGAYDLTGNVWEWTNTPVDNKEGFFWVSGGAWDTGDQAQCTHKRFSFYPNNKYLFVGFRCCWRMEF